MALTDDEIEQQHEVDLADPQSVASVVAGEQPDISPPENPMVELPRGIWLDGAWQTKVELHELTGEDEERFTRFSEDELFLNVLAAGVLRIGQIDLEEKPQPEREQIVNSLLIGEQLMLLINIIRVTFGNERELPWKCRNCQSDNTTTLLMSEDFQPKVPEDIRELHQFTDSKGNRISFVPASGVHVLNMNPEMSQGARNSLLLSNVITEINNARPLSTMEFVKQMGLKDRRDLLEAVDKAQPEIDLSLSIMCAICGKEQSTVLTWADLFRI